MPYVKLVAPLVSWLPSNTAYYQVLIAYESRGSNPGGFPKKQINRLLCSFFSSRKARERELAKFHENRRAGWECWNLRHKNEGMFIPGGRRDDTCYHGLSPDRIVNGYQYCTYFRNIYTIILMLLFFINLNLSIVSNSKRNGGTNYTALHKKMHWQNGYQ